MFSCFLPKASVCIKNFVVPFVVHQVSIVVNKIVFRMKKSLLLYESRILLCSFKNMLHLFYQEHFVYFPPLHRFLGEPNSPLSMMCICFAVCQSHLLHVHCGSTLEGSWKNW